MRNPKRIGPGMYPSILVITSLKPRAKGLFSPDILLMEATKEGIMAENVRNKLNTCSMKTGMM